MGVILTMPPPLPPLDHPSLELHVPLNAHYGADPQCYQIFFLSQNDCASKFWQKAFLALPKSPSPVASGRTTNLSGPQNWLLHQKLTEARECMTLPRLPTEPPTWKKMTKSCKPSCQRLWDWAHHPHATTKVEENWNPTSRQTPNSR